MVDYLYNEKNIVISPLNADTSLAYFYNGVDNNSKKELKINKKKIDDKKLKFLTINNPTIKNEKYEKYVKELINNKYNELRIKDLERLSQKEREHLVLILRKIELFSETNTHLKDKEIEKYTLTEREKKYNGYVLKDMIDNIMVNYEIYSIENKIISYT